MADRETHKESMDRRNGLVRCPVCSKMLEPNKYNHYPEHVLGIDKKGPITCRMSGRRVGSKP